LLQRTLDVRNHFVDRLAFQIGNSGRLCTGKSRVSDIVGSGKQKAAPDGVAIDESAARVAGARSTISAERADVDVHSPAFGCYGRQSWPN